MSKVQWILGYINSLGYFKECYLCTGDDEHVLMTDINPEENGHPNPDEEVNGYSIFKRVEMKLTNEEYGNFKFNNDYIEWHLRGDNH